MDTINKMNKIVEKLKTQMLAKGIDSIDKVFIVIADFDKEGTGVLDVLKFESFLSHIGCFLKSQELTEIHKFLGSYEKGLVSFEKFIGILKCCIDDSFLDLVNKVFEQIKDSENSVSVCKLKSIFNPEEHPRVKLMLKEVPQVLNEFDVAVKFVVGEKDVMTKEEFLELHKNMYWVTPKENMTYFNRIIPAIWRC